MVGIPHSIFFSIYLSANLSIYLSISLTTVVYVLFFLFNLGKLNFNIRMQPSLTFLYVSLIRTLSCFRSPSPSPPKKTKQNKTKQNKNKKTNKKAPNETHFTAVLSQLIYLKRKRKGFQLDLVNHYFGCFIFLPIITSDLQQKTGLQAHYSPVHPE